MATSDELVNLLVLAIREPLRRKESVAKFQALVWDGLDNSLPGTFQDVFRDLAYDLDFFEPRPDVRSEDEMLYGEERFESEIRDAFEKLRRAGVNVPFLGASK